MEAAWWAAKARTGEPGRPTAFAVKLLRGFGLPLVRFCHRARMDGFENLPSRPFMLVANHSAGLGLAEIASLAALWVDRFGADRPLVGFAHPLGFHLWPSNAFLRMCGAVPSTYEAGRATLAAGLPLLVFPGGMHETFRPIWQAHRVDFGGHHGFLRLAHEAGVPIVPVGIRGSHFTAPVLWRSRVLPWLFGLPRLFGLKVWPLTLLGVAVAAWLWTELPFGSAVRLAIVWAWLVSPLMFLSYVPATIRLRIGRPIPVDQLPVDGAPEEALRRVEAEVQRIVQELGKE